MATTKQATHSELHIYLKRQQRAVAHDKAMEKLTSLLQEQSLALEERISNCEEVQDIARMISIQQQLLVWRLRRCDVKELHEMYSGLRDEYEVEFRKYIGVNKIQ